MIQNGLSKQSSFGFSMHDESDGTFYILLLPFIILKTSFVSSLNSYLNRVIYKSFVDDFH